MIKKRFTFADGFKIVAIRDNGEIMNSRQVCEKLNELAEEKERLQHFESLYRERNLKLEKENKELRSDREYWKTLAQSLAKNNGNVKLKDEHLAWKRVDVE